MGRDKTQIAVSWHGETLPLWARQLRLLEGLEPGQLFYSGPSPAASLPEATIVADEWPDCGPLSGIASCLKVTTTDRLLCLAVDVPRIEAPVLRKLLETCRSGFGIVPRIGKHHEPLVAVYPKASLPLAIDQIVRRQLRLQDFTQRLLSEHLIDEYSVSKEEIPLFANWNAPGDMLRNSQRSANSQ